MANVVMLGTLDTKGAEFAFVRDRLVNAGLTVTLIDCGVLGEPTIPADIGREAVAKAAGSDLGELAGRNDRGAAVTTMARGAERVVADLHRNGKLDGAISLGGTGGTSIAAQAFRGLPLGVPKLIVSTAASADTSVYVGETDLVLFPSVVDIAGVNRISARILANAAAALAGMIGASRVESIDASPLVAASMFGVTTPCVTEGRRILESKGFEVLTFHMTGSGGRTLESLVDNGLLAGVLDITTTELADELVGGVFSAGPGRLTHSGPEATPRVVSVGALDMVNFGPMDTVPAQFRARNLFVHNPSVTLMRTTPQECAELGRRLAERVSALNVACVVMLPLRGVSAIAKADGPFHDPDADDALFSAIRAGLDGRIRLIEVDTDINDPLFAARAAAELQHLIGEASAKPALRN
ncbi:hypothetical protein VE25_08500 [Devosia geojensis]|uniref:Uncharacterized protein n=1 Tax=Devosia geojensis TaxID=443610 RepID=A0A0F5FVS7_9HYPH|nr:Tm-1-like ATP-binding domain-containing protein [Devosia geojensis]KKB12282.1 hypothetical protein VE25_08500 [Devosia geojensis]